MFSRLNSKSCSITDRQSSFSFTFWVLPDDSSNKGLCKTARVPFAENDERLATIGPITKQAVGRIAFGKTPMEDSIHEEEAQREENTDKEPETSNKNSASGRAFTEIYQEQIMGRLMSLQKTIMEQNEMLKSMQKEQQNLKREVSKIKRKNRLYCNYARVRDVSVATCFSRVSNQGTLPFPQFPTALLHDSDAEELSDD